MQAHDVPSTGIATVLFRRDRAGELFATVGIDPATIDCAPVGESLRVDISADDDVSLCLHVALRTLNSLRESMPMLGELIGVFHDPKEGRVVFLPDRGNANGADTLR